MLSEKYYHIPVPEISTRQEEVVFGLTMVELGSGILLFAGSVLFLGFGLGVFIGAIVGFLSVLLLKKARTILERGFFKAYGYHFGIYKIPDMPQGEFFNKVYFE